MGQRLTQMTKGLCAVMIALLLLHGTVVLAVEVTISAVTEKDDATIPLEQLQDLRKSPFGGWVVATWPFSLRVDDQLIMEHKSELQKLVEEAAPLEGAEGKQPDDLAGEILGEKKAQILPFAEFRFDRPSSAKVDLQPGEHVITPGNLRFSVSRNGALQTKDARLRVRQEDRVVEILCRPVTMRAFAGERSAPFPLKVTWGKTDLLEGLVRPIEEFERKSAGKETAVGPLDFRRIVLYAPPVDDADPYALCDVPFVLDPAGKVRVGNDGRVRSAGESELRVVLPPSAPARRLLGVRWLNAAGEWSVSAGGVTSPAAGESGSVFLPVALPDGSKKLVVQFNAAGRRGQYSVEVPADFDAWPHKVVIFNAAGPPHYLFEAAQFVVPPGGEYRCRLAPVGAPGKEAAGLPCRLELAGRPATAIDLSLSAGPNSTFAATLPADIRPGLWRVVAGAGSALQGVPLGLILVANATPATSVSIYTYRNRGLFRRGDQADIYCTARVAKQAKDAGKLSLVLSGLGLEREIATIDLGGSARQTSEKQDSQGAVSVVTEHLRLDTAALAPGDYEVDVRPEGFISYPARFRVCQREPRTDYEIYSHEPFAPVKANAGTPLTAYYGGNPAAEEPGLEPLRAGVCGGLDAAFAAYACAAAGPAVEKCFAPDEDEVELMALAGMGARAVPAMPSMLHHEEWNPKHTLPDELRRLQRRLALFTQKYADVPGFGGVRLNWYATVGGYWEESEPLDGHQALRNAEAGKWVAEMVARRVEEEKAKDPDPERLKVVAQQADFEYRSMVLPRAYERYLVDARAVLTGLTSHSGIPSFWLGGGHSYPPAAYSTLTHRDAVDYTDYGRSPWGEFRAPAFLDMGNPTRQRTQCCYMAYGRHARFIVSFGAAGRGLDGFAITPQDDYAGGEDAALQRIFERFGSYFTALEPLPDVAVYFSPAYPWPQQKSVILHDLARLRRPGVILSQEDVLAGKLDKYNVLFVAALGDGEPRAVLDAFGRFEKKGGVVLKDKLCSEKLPGRDIGFAYDKDQVHNGWGLAWPDGEWEFAHLWTNYTDHREAPLLKAFENTRPIPVTTSDREVVISPLAGKDSVCCFVINMTYVPMSVQGKWRQHAALPRKADLIVADGWHVRDLLSGQPCALEKRDGLNRVTMDFTRAEGKVYLLTRREPKAMAMRTERVGPLSLRLSAWLADGEDKPIEDAMPFEVTLTAPGGSVLFHKYAALAPDRPLDLAMPAMKAEGGLTLTVRDLVTGCISTQNVLPADSGVIAAGAAVDVVGGERIVPFLKERKGRVLVLLDEAQGKYRGAAERMLALLKAQGRDAKLMTYDPAEVMSLPLRWKLLDKDREVLRRTEAGEGIAWRVDLPPYKAQFDNPACGYAEYGPRTWIEADAVLFGSPADSLALQDLNEFLRRRPSENYPSLGRFFVHYVWDAFAGGCDAVYIGCRDATGAESAVEYLSKLAREARPGTQNPPPPAAAPVITWGRERRPLEDMIAGKIGTRIIDAAFSPTGNRMFVTADSYGDSLFVLDGNGGLIEKRPIQNRCGNNVWYREGGALQALDDERLYVRLWNSDYLMSTAKGFLSRETSPPHGLPGHIKVRIAGRTLHKDTVRGRTYLGGPRKLRAIDAQGGLIWTYDDCELRTGTADMLFPRSIFIRGVSPDGKLLLASAFGIEQDVYGIGTVRNPSIFCMDTESGRALWSKEGLLLNEGKAILADDRFLVVDDDGRFHALDARTGALQGSIKPVGGTDWVVPIPGSHALLVVENNHFDAEGPTNRAYLRAPGDRPDVTLSVGGRIVDATLAPDGKRILLSSERGETACFDTAGKELWRAETPTGGVVRCSPDGKTALVGTREGTLHFLDMAKGTVTRTFDVNPYNLTSGEQFVKQLGSIGDVPQEKAAQAPPEPPEQSYLVSLKKEAAKFGRNLLPADKVLASLKPADVPPGDPARPAFLALLEKPVEFKLKVERGRTYLVEFLNASADAGKLTAQTRLEVTVSGSKKSRNLPFTARLPVGERLVRRRLAFRTDDQGEVTLTLRAIVPAQAGEGRGAQLSYAAAQASTMPALIGDMVVASMSFASRDLLLDRGPGEAGRGPKGRAKCEVWPWSGGANLKHWWEYDAPKSALAVTDGIVGNQETSWHYTKDVPTGGGIAYANAWVTFDKPQLITAVAVYEDNSGPIASGQGVREKIAVHYGIYVHEAKTDRWRRVGYVADNTNLVNVFAFPAVEADKVRYFWAGRDYAGVTDGLVRMAEIEAYSTEDADMFPDEQPGHGGEEGTGDAPLDDLAP